MSSEHKQLLKGSEKSDSFTWDPHKMLGTGLMCSTFLVQNARDLQEVCQVTGTEYLYHNEDNFYDLGLTSLQCGRRVDVVKLWLLWKHYGDKGFSDQINHLFDLGLYAQDIIKEHSCLELMVPIQTVNVCFRYMPSQTKDIDSFNIQLRETLRKTGKALVNYATYCDQVMIRLPIVNLSLTQQDIDAFFNNMVSKET